MLDDLVVSGLSRVHLRDAAARVIRAQIIVGRLSSDELYSIGDIAERLNVSPTPVREALVQLAAEGLVELVRNRGFRVRAFDDRDLDEIVACRLMLEVPAIGQLAGADQLTDFDGIRRLCDQACEAAAGGDITRFLIIDRDFHLSLLERAGNRHLVDIVARLRDQTRLYGLARLAGSPDLIGSAREHSEILQAVERGHVSEAEKLMRQHLLHARGLWVGRDESLSSAAGSMPLQKRPMAPQNLTATRDDTGIR